jgi:hypothetical protein
VIAWAARGTRAEEGRRWVAGLPDLLLYASMIDDGILLLQDGALDGDLALCRSRSRFRHSRRDGGSCGTIEFRLKLGSGWLVHCDAIRSE